MARLSDRGEWPLLLGRQRREGALWRMQVCMKATGEGEPRARIRLRSCVTLGKSLSHL